MTKRQFLAEIRDLIGNPSSGSSGVPDRRLESFAVAGLDWLAAKLRYSLREDTTSFALTANLGHYGVPTDVNQILWLSYAGQMLSPSTTQMWRRDGVDYRNGDAGIPAEYAFEGREVIFDRPLSASAIASYPRAEYKFVSSTPGITAAGIPRLPDADARLAATFAAWRWCAVNPSQENAARLSSLKAMIDFDLAEALARHNQPIDDQQPSFEIATPRMGGAR